MDTLPPVDSFVVVPFGAQATQVAHVVGHTKTGRVKVRAWNSTQRRWMPGLRTMDLIDICRPAGERATGLPTPPSI